jgi:hypothetical protein
MICSKILKSFFVLSFLARGFLRALKKFGREITRLNKYGCLLKLTPLKPHFFEKYIIQRLILTEACSSI